jgi:hypothetical protein
MSYKQKMGSKEIYSGGTFNKRTEDLISASSLGDPNTDPTISGSGTFENAGLTQGMQGNLNGKFGSLLLENNTTPNYRTLLYSDLDPSIRAQARKDNLLQYGTHNPTAQGLTDNKIQSGSTTSYTGQFNSPPTPDTPEVRVDAFSNLGRRQQIRGIKTGTAMEKRNTMKAARNDAKKEKGKNIFETLKLRKEFTKKARIAAKTKMTNDRASQIKEVNSQRQKQNEQGVNHRLGKNDKVVKTEGIKGSPFTPAKFGFVSFDQFVKNKKK